MKSSLKVKAPFITKPMHDFGFGKKIITVSKLPITNEEYKLKCEEFSKTNNVDLKKAESIVQSKLVQIEAFNNIMDYISSLFDFKIDASELKSQIEAIKDNAIFQNVKPENKSTFIENFAKKILVKHLIFDYFIADYNQLDVDLKDVELFMSANKMLDKTPENQKAVQIKNFQRNAIENKVIDWLIHQYKIVIKMEK